MSDPYGPPSAQDPSEGVSQDEKTWALTSHIGSLVTAWIAFGFIAPLLVMLIKSDSPFVRRHAVESLNFQISMLIYSLVGGLIAFVIIIVTFGVAFIIIFPLIAIVLLVVLVLVIQATIAASRGEPYEYPFTIRFVS